MLAPLEFISRRSVAAAGIAALARHQAPSSLDGHVAGDQSGKCRRIRISWQKMIALSLSIGQVFCAAFFLA
jgi:hypothetical protein